MEYGNGKYNIQLPGLKLKQLFGLYLNFIGTNIKCRNDAVTAYI